MSAPYTLLRTTTILAQSHRSIARSLRHIQSQNRGDRCALDTPRLTSRSGHVSRGHRRTAPARLFTHYFIGGGGGAFNVIRCLTRAYARAKAY